MKTITFRNGDPMPLFGLGTYQSKANELHDAIISALKDGYRLIDCAAYYKNEEIIGAALQETFTSELVKREELYGIITTPRNTWKRLFERLCTISGWTTWTCT